MKVYFIGAGPGAPDLITLRGARLLNQCKMVMYAGSLIPDQMLDHCQSHATIINTAGLDLDAQTEHFKAARAQDIDVARLHSGDPSIYGALAEQMKRLRQLEIEFEVVPGVSSFTAAAALIGAELTKPGVSQTIILTRVSGRASPVPEAESLGQLARHGATMCIFLSGPHLQRIVSELSGRYPPDTPLVLVKQASWKQETRLESTLGRVLSETSASDWALTTMLLIGDVLRSDSGSDSKLYSPAYAHKFRKVKENAV